MCLGFTSGFGWRPPLWLLTYCDPLLIIVSSNLVLVIHFSAYAKLKMKYLKLTTWNFFTMIYSFLFWRLVGFCFYPNISYFKTLFFFVFTIDKVCEKDMRSHIKSSKEQKKLAPHYETIPKSIEIKKGRPPFFLLSIVFTKYSIKRFNIFHGLRYW